MASDSPWVATALDTNVIVAGLLSWHEHYEVAAVHLIGLLESTVEIVLPLPVLVTGGTAYDGLILACARKGGARRLLTFNRSHFERMATEEIEIVVPGSTAAQL